MSFFFNEKLILYGILHRILCILLHYIKFPDLIKRNIDNLKVDHLFNVQNNEKNLLKYH